MEENQEVITVGEETFAPDELQEYVRLGKLAKEVEEKQNTKIDKVMGAWTKDTQKLKDYEIKLQEYETKLAQAQTPPTPQDGDLSPEQLRQVREQLHKVGALTEENVNKVVAKMVQDQVSQMFAGRDLLSQAKKAIRQATDTYGVTADLESVLQYMNDEGVRSPDKAIKHMYEADIDKVKEQKLKEARGQGLYTSQSSRTKTPAYQLDYKDKDKVRKAMREVLNGEA